VGSEGIINTRRGGKREKKKKKKKRGGGGAPLCSQGAMATTSKISGNDYRFEIASKKTREGKQKKKKGGGKRLIKMVSRTFTANDLQHPNSLSLLLGFASISGEWLHRIR